MNQQRHAGLRKQLVSAARSIIANQVALPVGCMRLFKIMHWLEPFERVDYPVVSKYLRAADGLPLGTERLNCSREALRRFDRQLERINGEYREAVLDACFDILDRFGLDADDDGRIDRDRPSEPQ